MTHTHYLIAAYAFTALCMVVEAIALHRRRINAINRRHEMLEDAE